MPILAIEFPTFQPAMRIIASITKSATALITTTFDHQYATGTIVRLNVPDGYGMLQANRLYAPITVVSPTSFTMPIDTTSFDAFAVPTTFPENRQSAQATVMGEVNALLTQAERNVLPYPLQ